MELIFKDDILEGLQFAAGREGIAVETYCYRVLRNLAAPAYKAKQERDKQLVVEMIDRGEIKAADCIAPKAAEKPEEPVIDEPIIDDPIVEDPIVDDPIIKDGEV